MRKLPKFIYDEEKALEVRSLIHSWSKFTLSGSFVLYMGVYTWIKRVIEQGGGTVREMGLI